jgi:hypothetical protein
MSNDSRHSTNTHAHKRCEDSDIEILDVGDQLGIDIDMQPHVAHQKSYKCINCYMADPYDIQIDQI